MPLVDHHESSMILSEEIKDDKGRGTGFAEILGFRDHGWGNVTRGFFGVHLGTRLGRVRSAPDNAPASSGWMATQHVTGVLGVGAFALQLEWQQQTEHFDYDRGFGGEMVSHGLVTWVGYSPSAVEGTLGISLGYGTSSDATLSLGSQDNRALYGSVDASSAFYGVSLDTFVIGGGMFQWGIRPRLVIGYSSVDADMPLPNLPTSYSGVSVGVEAVGTMF